MARSNDSYRGAVRNARRRGLRGGMGSKKSPIPMFNPLSELLAALRKQSADHGVGRPPGTKITAGRYFPTPVCVNNCWVDPRKWDGITP